jgi:hypothetical protein
LGDDYLSSVASLGDNNSGKETESSMAVSPKKEMARLSAKARREAVRALKRAEQLEKAAADATSVAKKKSLRDLARVKRYFHDMWRKIEKIS